MEGERGETERLGPRWLGEHRLPRKPGTSAAPGCVRRGDPFGNCWERAPKPARRPQPALAGGEALVNAAPLAAGGGGALVKEPKKRKEGDTGWGRER